MRKYFMLISMLSIMFVWNAQADEKDDLIKRYPYLKERTFAQELKSDYPFAESLMSGIWVTEDWINDYSRLNPIKKHKTILIFRGTGFDKEDIIRNTQSYTISDSDSFVFDFISEDDPDAPKGDRRNGLAIIRKERIGGENSERVAKYPIMLLKFLSKDRFVLELDLYPPPGRIPGEVPPTVFEPEGTVFVKAPIEKYEEYLMMEQ